MQNICIKSSLKKKYHCCTKNTVPPQIVPFDFGEEVINVLDMVSATCTVKKGDLPIQISWLHNGFRVMTNDGIVINRMGQRISTLSIESVRDRHRGNFTCVAKNDAGYTDLTVDLSVKGENRFLKIFYSNLKIFSIFLNIF